MGLNIRKILEKKFDKLLKNVIVCKDFFSAIHLEGVLDQDLALIFYKILRINILEYLDFPLASFHQMMMML